MVRNEADALEGIAAVIDKDFGSSLLATNVGAELFVISTAVEKVALNFGKPDQKWLDRHAELAARVAALTVDVAEYLRGLDVEWCRDPAIDRVAWHAPCTV